MNQTGPTAQKLPSQLKNEDTSNESSRNTLDELASKVETLSKSTEKLVETAESHQKIVSRMVTDVGEQRSLVYFGFIIMVVMVGAIVIDVLSNTFGKEESGAPVQIIYQVKSVQDIELPK